MIAGGGVMGAKALKRVRLAPYVVACRVRLDGLLEEHCRSVDVAELLVHKGNHA